MWEEEIYIKKKRKKENVSDERGGEPTNSLSCRNFAERKSQKHNTKGPQRESQREGKIGLPRGKVQLTELSSNPVRIAKERVRGTEKFNAKTRPGTSLEVINVVFRGWRWMVRITEGGGGGLEQQGGFFFV